MRDDTLILRKFIIDLLNSTPHGNMRSRELESNIENAGLYKTNWQREARKAGLLVKHLRNDIGNYWLYYVPNWPD